MKLLNIIAIILVCLIVLTYLFIVLFKYNRRDRRKNDESKIQYFHHFLFKQSMQDVHLQFSKPLP